MNANDLILNLKKAKYLRKHELYSYNYEYFDKNGISFELDRFSTTRYGSSSKAFNRWIKNSHELVINKNNDVIVKFCSSKKNSGEINKIVFINRLVNEGLIDQLRHLFDEIFDEICKMLSVTDKDSFRYYILGGEEYIFLTAEDIVDRINKLEQTFRLYYIDEKMKILINKIIR